MPVNESSEAIVPEDNHCVKCNKTFTNPRDLKRHLIETIIHRGEAAQRFSCTVDKCDKKFTTKCNLNNHIKVIHNSSPRLIGSLKNASRSTAFKGRRGAKGDGKGKDKAKGKGIAKGKSINKGKAKASQVARPSVSREALPVLDAPSTSSNSQLPPPEANPLADSTNVATSLGAAGRKDGGFNFDYLANPNTVTFDPANKHGPGGASKSKNSHLAPSDVLRYPPSPSPSEAKEAFDPEALLEEYFREYGIEPLSFKGSLKTATDYGLQNSSSAPDIFNNIAAGSSSVPDQSWPMYDDEGPISKINSARMLEILNDVSVAHEHLSGQFAKAQESRPSSQPPQPEESHPSAQPSSPPQSRPSIQLPQIPQSRPLSQPSQAQESNSSAQPAEPQQACPSGQLGMPQQPHPQPPATSSFVNPQSMPFAKGDDTINNFLAPDYSSYLGVPPKQDLHGGAPQLNYSYTPYSPKQQGLDVSLPPDNGHSAHDPITQEYQPPRPYMQSPQLYPPPPQPYTQSAQLYSQPPQPYPQPQQPHTQPPQPYPQPPQPHTQPPQPPQNPWAQVEARLKEAISGYSPAYPWYNLESRLYPQAPPVPPVKTGEEPNRIPADLIPFSDEAQYQHWLPVQMQMQMQMQMPTQSHVQTQPPMPQPPMPQPPMPQLPMQQLPMPQPPMQQLPMQQPPMQQPPMQQPPVEMQTHTQLPEHMQRQLQMINPQLLMLMLQQMQPPTQANPQPLQTVDPPVPSMNTFPQHDVQPPWTNHGVPPMNYGPGPAIQAPQQDQSNYSTNMYL